jgi:hypothetical protein
MPAREKTRAHSTPASPPAVPAAGPAQALLVLGAVISAALLTAALALTTSGHKTCARPLGTACTSLSIPRQAAAGRR